MAECFLAMGKIPDMNFAFILNGTLLQLGISSLCGQSSVTSVVNNEFLMTLIY